MWPLLEPVGRRVNIEALSNKKLAVGTVKSSGLGVLRRSSIARPCGYNSTSFLQGFGVHIYCFLPILVMQARPD